jgi:hypothetical protein
VVQLVHVFENHEHVSCTSKEVKHIHAKEIDCDIFHRPYQEFSLDIPFQSEEIPKHYYITTFAELPKLVAMVHHNKNKPRGPPIIV